MTLSHHIGSLWLDGCVAIKVLLFLDENRANNHVKDVMDRKVARIYSQTVAGWILSHQTARRALIDLKPWLNHQHIIQLATKSNPHDVQVDFTKSSHGARLQIYGHII